MNSAMPVSSASSARERHPQGLTRSDTFDVLWAQIALIGVTICACNAAVYYPLRLGLYTPPLLIPSCFLIFSATLLGPLLLPSRGVWGSANLRCVAMPLVSLLVLASLLLAFALQSYLIIAYALVFAAGAWRALQLLRTQSAWQLIFCVCTGCVVGLYLFCTVQSLGYAGVYTPEQSLLGTLNHDTTFHSAITFVIQNFGVPSAALDGIIPIKYHFGSHFWFAALGKLSSSKPLFSYGAGVPIVLAPMLVVALLLSVISLDRGRKPLVGYLLAGLGIILLSDVIGWNSYYISETYTCGLIGFLLLLPLLAHLADGPPLSPRRATVALAIAVAAIPPLFFLKISVGALWTAALGWVVLRRFGFGMRGMLAGFAAGVVFLCMMWTLSPSTQDYRTVSNHLIVPFFFFRLFPAAGLACFIIPFMLLFSKTRIYGGEGLRRVFLNKSDLMFEAAMIVMIFGSIPPLLGIPQDSALWYFLNVAQWAAMPLLVARFAPEGAGLSQKILLARSFPLVVGASLGALTLITGVYKQVTAVVIAADERGEGKLLHGGGALQYFRGAMAQEHVLWGGAFRNILAAAPGGQLMQSVQNAFPIPDRTAAVFIPPENTAFWTLFSTPRCLDKYNVQVSMTGQPSLLGGPPVSYGCGRDAYTSEYGAHFESRSISDADLCAHAQQRNMHRVLIFAGNDHGARDRILDCATKSSR